MQQYSNTAVNSGGLNFNAYFTQIASTILSTAENCCAACFHNNNNCYLYDYNLVTQSCIQYNQATSLSSFQRFTYSKSYYVTNPNHVSGIYY